MALTALKQVENRSSATVALSNRENANVLGNLVSIPPGGNLAVDMWIPWAPNGWDFPGKQIEVQLNGQPRFAIWQAAKSDGDFVRFSSDRAWHDPGERIFGIPEVNGDRTLRVMDRYCSLLPYALPVPFPWVTSITRVENWSDQVVALVSTENPNSPIVQINPAQTAVVNLPIPWAGQGADFPTHHVRLSLNGQPRYWLWQAAGTDGDLVRYSSDGQWHHRAEPVQGVSGVNGRRTLVVNKDLCFSAYEP